MLRVPDESALIYDWERHTPQKKPGPVMVWDETLRDGLQSPSVRDPDLDEKVKILDLMESLGIDAADVGLPGAGKRQYQAVMTMCREISTHRMRIQPFCAGRTVIADIAPMAEISQKTGIALGAALFIGSSPIRQYAEEWNLDLLLARSREAVEFAVREGLEVLYVTEDTVRSSPEDLRVLFAAAIEAGASRICLCDTVGAATPEGTFNLVRWTLDTIDDLGTPVGVDWHGHRDRGLDMANVLAAVRAGATRVHGTALGIGERVGNACIEQILVNLRLLGLRHDDLGRLPEYVNTVAAATRVPIPINSPIVGRDAFRTATGVHASAVLKAEAKGESWLADRVYSGVPASWIGRRQEIEVGHMSGVSNVVHYLRSRDLPHDRAIVDAVIAAAKESAELLTHAQILDIVQRLRHPPEAPAPGS
jgi:2-isopropylmalate synthase